MFPVKPGKGAKNPFSPVTNSYISSNTFHSSFFFDPLSKMTSPGFIVLRKASTKSFRVINISTGRPACPAIADGVAFLAKAEHFVDSI